MITELKRTGNVQALLPSNAWLISDPCVVYVLWMDGIHFSIVHLFQWGSGSLFEVSGLGGVVLSGLGSPLETVTMLKRTRFPFHWLFWNRGICRLAVLPGYC